MPNNYDKIIKENFDQLLPHLLRVVLGLDLPKLETLTDKQQVTLERELDNLKKVVHDDPTKDFCLHWEFQTQDEDMCGRNLLYYGVCYKNYRLPVKQIVVYLGDDPPNKILNNTLEMEGLKLNFTVIVLKDIPKDVFLQSGTPEGVILAILSDFGSDKPAEVIRQILQHLLQLIGRVPRLKKYQRQLHVLSRLRKLSAITKIEIEAMPIHYEIETDELYLEGIEKGIEKGIDIGVEKGMTVIVTRLLKRGNHSLSDITLLLDVSEDFVRKVAESLGITIN